MAKCPICSLARPSFFSRKDGYAFVKCNMCHLIFMDPLPQAKELIRNYYSTESGYHCALPNDVKKIKKFSRKFTNVIRGLARFKMAGNLLDVGCANGEFLFLAKQHGFTPYGVEANAYTAKIASQNGFPVFNGTLEQMYFENAYFSVIYLGDVIEHVTNPIVLLKECKRILKKGGIMVVSTPNTDCFWVVVTQRICGWFKFPWSVLHPPYHVYLFSTANFKKLMHTLGFTVLETTYHHPSLRHELGVTGLLKKYKSGKSITALLYMTSVFFTYAIVYCINFLLKPFFKKDFEMIVFAKN